MEEALRFFGHRVVTKARAINNGHKDEKPQTPNPSPEPNKMRRSFKNWQELRKTQADNPWVRDVSGATSPPGVRACFQQRSD